MVSLKSFTKSVGKVFNTAADLTTGGSYSKVTGASSYLNDLTGGSYFDMIASGAGALGSIYGGNMNLSNLVQGAIGLGQDWLNSQMDIKQQKELMDYSAKKQTELNQQAWQQNVDMWNMQNAYNDPSAQMQRLEAAGLNKNMVYGSGNVTGTTTSNAPQVSPATYGQLQSTLASNRAQRMSQAMQLQHQALQNKQLELSMQQFNQQIQNQSIQNDLARQRLYLNARNMDRMDRYTQAQINAIDSLIKTRDDPYKTGAIKNIFSDIADALIPDHKPFEGNYDNVPALF